jgi:tetratricopeptide (TPR) repeat protein
VSYEEVMAAAAAQWARAESANTDLRRQLAVVMVLNMANDCLRLFETTGSREDLSAAITLYLQVLDSVALNSSNSSLMGEVLSKLGHALSRRFSITGSPGDLDGAIEAYQQVTAFIAHDGLVEIQYFLGTVLVERWQRTADPADLTRAIEAMSESEAGEPRRQARLGWALVTRYEVLGAAEDLDRGIDVLHRALASLPVDDLFRDHAEEKLANAYPLRYLLTEDLADLDRFVAARHDIVKTLPADHPRRAWSLMWCGMAHHGRYDHSGQLADLDAAVDWGRRAVAADPDHRVLRFNFARALHIRFLHDTSLENLHAAIEQFDRAMAAADLDDSHRVLCAIEASTAYRYRFDHEGDPADLNRAKELGEQAVRAEPENPIALGVMSAVDLSRYHRFGMKADLDRAIELGTRAVSAGTSVDARTLDIVSAAHMERYKHYGVLADLRRAVELSERACAEIPRHSPKLRTCLQNLATRLHSRFERTGDRMDLDRAIEIGEQIRATAAGAMEVAFGLANLAGCYLQRYQHTGAAADLDRAVALGEETREVMPADHHERAQTLSSLGKAYEARFLRDKVAADLERAADLFERAAATPADSAQQAEVAANVVQVGILRLTELGQSVPRDVLTNLVTGATADTASPLVDRLRLSAGLGMLAHLAGEHDLAVAQFDAAVAMAPLTAPRESDWVDQEHRLGMTAGLIREAVAAHCANGDPAGAVMAAELGRGVLLAAKLDSRTDLTDLAQAHPNLATRFRSTRDRLNAPEAGVDLRRKHWAEHDDLVAEIRRLPNFDRFLVPPGLPDLKHATAGGAVVVVNSGAMRSDALVVTESSDPVDIELPDLRLPDVLEKAQALLDASHDNRRLAGPQHRMRVLPSILTWLWDAIVEPVIDALPIDLSRVWWLPTGLLGIFPLHAAGHPGHPGALDRLVSSYIPTLRALAYARSQSPAVSRDQLIVTLADAPGLPPLPHTTAEAAALRARQPGSRVLVGTEATTTAVTAALLEVTWAHFACHADADLNAPARSGLHLHDGMYFVPDISRLRLTNAELAYLSACSTAHPGTRDADQSLHLASAFQLAGFRHVIASLWPLNDRIAANAAESFYRDLTSADASSVTLRQTALDLRAKYPDRPDYWAALIHSGA